jgi:hypothetical protein
MRRQFGQIDKKTSQLMYISTIAEGSKGRTKASSAFSVTETDCLSIQLHKDGRYFVNPETSTSVCHGARAKLFLESTRVYQKRTQIAVPSEAVVAVTCEDIERARYKLSEPGVILINPGTELNLEVSKGDVLVIVEDRMPYWYEQYTPGKNFPNIYNEMIRHHKGGYDCSGLAWQSHERSIVIYKHSGRRNYWIDGPEEWMSSSIMDGGKDGAFSTGVSRVFSSLDQREETVVNFKQIRANETLHTHPVRDGDKKVTEVYLVCRGKACFLFIKDSKPHFIFLHPGDMVIVNPGTVHAIIAAETPYEHLVIQIPTVFQYGYWFKENIPPEAFGLDMERIFHLAKSLLGNGKRGRVGIDPRDEIYLKI